jgi:hypothetical protein
MHRNKLTKVIRSKFFSKRITSTEQTGQVCRSQKSLAFSETYREPLDTRPGLVRRRVPYTYWHFSII